MGKSKTTKSPNSIPSKHLYLRISFLHKAATYLATNNPCQEHQPANSTPRYEISNLPQTNVRPVVDDTYGQTRHLLSQLRGVSRKSQTRLSKDIKHSVCKRCDSLLIADETSVEDIRNDSKEGSKPWAAVLEIKCKNCGTVKRFPTGQQRIQKARIKKARSSSKPIKGKIVDSTTGRKGQTAAR